MEVYTKLSSLEYTEFKTAKEITSNHYLEEVIAIHKRLWRAIFAYVLE